MTALLVAAMALPGAALAAQASDAKLRADACLDRAAHADRDARFQDLADGYLCAAEETAKIPDPARAARFKGLAHLARAWDYYARGVTGTAGRSNLDEALRQVDLALPLLRSPGALPGLAGLADGWREFLLGTKAGLDGRHAESRTHFETARTLATGIATSIPPLRGKAERLASLAQDQIAWAHMSMLLLDPQAFLDRGGEINQHLAELRERAEGDARHWYEGLRHLYEGRRRFEEASQRLESWQYPEASAFLDQAQRAFAAARSALAGIPREMRREEFGALVDGLAAVTGAEQHHARALEALLAKGDPTAARSELSSGARLYRSAQDAFEKAGHSAGSIASLRALSRRLGERAAALEQAFSVRRVLLGVGGAFLAIFLGAVGLLAALQSRLGLDGKLLVAVALAVSIIGAFGLESPRILEAVGKVLRR
jgi:hypothetical protein